jgi:hypothetical protein
MNNEDYLNALEYVVSLRETIDLSKRHLEWAFKEYAPEESFAINIYDNQSFEMFINQETLSTMDSSYGHAYKNAAIQPNLKILLVPLCKNFNAYRDSVARRITKNVSLLYIPTGKLTTHQKSIKIAERIENWSYNI